MLSQCQPIHCAALPPVKNLTIVAVSARSVSLSWNVSQGYRIYYVPLHKKCFSILSAILLSKFYLLYTILSIIQEEGNITVNCHLSSTSQTKYTLRNLQSQQQYRISIRAETQYHCSSTFSFTSARQYGEYSNEVSVMTG